jgi:beta-phosphoglucomutase-like phosphatase (HAD superfamily)
MREPGEAMMINALIFDVDGTLADTEQAHLASFNGAFEAHGLDWHWSGLDYVRYLKVAGGKERLSAYIDTLPLGISERRALSLRIPEIHRTKTELYARLVACGKVALRGGVARLIHEAECAGVRLAIASTTTRENIDALLRAQLGARALERFAVIGAGDEVARKKPASDIYRLVLERLGKSARECVAFEDSAHGLIAAQGAGLFTVVTPTRWTRDADLSAGDLLLSSLASCDSPLMEIEYAFAAARRKGWRPRNAAVGEI